MTPKLARQHLALRRPNGADDSSAEMKAALDTAHGDSMLTEALDAQITQDTQGSALLSALDLPPQATTDIEAAAHAFSHRHSGAKVSLRNPATLAVALGFLLLIAVLTWHFLGQAGVFPDEAIRIATEGAAARPDQFDQVEDKSGQLQDWFMLKGFDDFRVPPGFENFDVIGVRLFKSDNEPIAQAAVAENTMFFYCFASQPLGIDVRPEKSWRITEVDRTVIAIREERGVCFMISFRGTKQQMEQFLRQTGQ